MRVVEFNHEEPYGSNERDRPTVPFRFESPEGDRYTSSAVLDTGAWTSVFAVTLAPLFGIVDVDSGEETWLRLPNGEEVLAYSHPCRLQVLGRWLTIRVAFSPQLPSDMVNLLGMRDLFEELVVGFTHRERLVLAT